MEKKMEVYDVRGKTVYVKEEDMCKAMQEAKEQAYTHCVNGTYNRKVYISVDIDGNCYVGDLGPNEIVQYDEDVIRVYEITTFVLDEDDEYVTCAEELELRYVDDDEVQYHGRPYIPIPRWL